MTVRPLSDHQVRSAAFAWLSRLVDTHGDELPYRHLADGFMIEGYRVPLLGPQGIFKPQVLAEIPLSITTAPNGRYNDSFDDQGLLAYRYRGTDPGHRDNAGLRLAMQRRTPLIYLHGIVRGKYLAAWPVYVVGDDPQGLTFTVAIDDVNLLDRGTVAVGAPCVADPRADESRRVYITGIFRRRLHQRGFRERVMQAYRSQCAMCRLKHDKLLDAAHIIGDTEAGGEPVVPNGLSLCKIHHAAFDQHFLGVSPDCRILVRQDILVETDGPMLRHGLQELHGTALVLPRRPEQQPDRDRLALRFERFRKAG